MASDGVKITIHGDIVPRWPDMKPADVLLATVQEYAKSLGARHAPMRASDLPGLTAPCESQQQPAQDFQSVLTAVMALGEDEQQQIYVALYKAGRRIYRE